MHVASAGSAGSIILSVSGVESMMLSAFAESMILSAPVVTAVFVLLPTSYPSPLPLLPPPPPLLPYFPLQLLVNCCLVPPAESMILSARAESIILSEGGAEMSIILSAYHAESSHLVMIR
jgi:hypothetical protein